MLLFSVLYQTVFQNTFHHWPLDNAGKIINLQSDKHGFTSGNVKAVSGPVNSALATDGITGQINLVDLRESCILKSPHCPNGFTLRFWLKFAANDQKERRIYLSVGDDKENTRGFQVIH